MLRDRIRSYSTEFFSFKIEETYTLTTFVDQKLSFSVYSKSTYDSLVLAAILRFVKIIEKNIGLPVTWCFENLDWLPAT